MTIENNTTPAPAATYTHDTLSYGDFLAYANSLSGPVIEADTRNATQRVTSGRKRTRQAVRQGEFWELVPRGLQFGRHH